MRYFTVLVLLLSCALGLGATSTTRPLPREQWGAPPIEVRRAENGGWRIEGKRQRVILDGQDHSIEIHCGNVIWRIVPPAADALRVRREGKEFPLRLEDARRVDVQP